MKTIDLTVNWREIGLDISYHLYMFNQMKLFLAEQAREVALRSAVSYRNFSVGCALLAFNPNAYYYRSVHKVFRGANVKIGEGSHKICAEQIAINAARAEKYPLIVGMAIAGVPQPDGKSGLKTETLHPCSDCRDLMQALPEILDDTRIFTAHLHEEIFAEFTVAELLAMHC